MGITYTILSLLLFCYTVQILNRNLTIPARPLGSFFTTILIKTTPLPFEQAQITKYSKHNHLYHGKNGQRAEQAYHNPNAECEYAQPNSLCRAAHTEIDHFEPPWITRYYLPRIYNIICTIHIRCYSKFIVLFS